MSRKHYVSALFVGFTVATARAESLRLEDRPVYHLPVESVVSGLHTHAKRGLDDAQVLDFRDEFGSNMLEQVKPKNPFVMFFFHMFNTVTLILYAVFTIAMVNKELVDAIVILFIIVANAVIGFLQEWKSEMSLNALQRMSAGTAEVVRNGSSQVVGIDEVVVGDVVILKQGYQVPADARLVEAINLEVDEALLTGESLPVVKHTMPLEIPEQVNGLDVRVALGDRANMVFRQTIVVAGTGVAVVTATGYDTKVGQLSKALQSGGDEKTPMQKNMDRFLLVIFGMAIVIAFVIFCITGLKFDRASILYASATGIAILPESLVAVVTVSLALAVTRMALKRAIVRKIASVEVLGTVTNICSDKTGTLTEGKMVVKRVWPAGSKYVYHVTGGPMDATAGFGVELVGADVHPSAAIAPPSFPHEVPAVDMQGPEAQFSVVQAAVEELAMVAGMCNNTQLQVDEENDKLVGTGTPTELALAAFAFKAGLSPAHFEAQNWRTCGQWAFDSSVKCMSVGVVRALADAETQRLVLCKGAPEAVLPKCRPGVVPMDEVMEKVDNLASQGFRVLACAIGDHLPIDDIDGKRLHDFPRTQVEAGLRFVGLCMVLDPPRPESAMCVNRCREAGIQFHMVTGDHQLTAENIARRIHILRPQDGRERIVTGPVFDAMSEEQIDAIPELPLVIARCSPESKVKMVQALHRRGKIVAMTGDGINDAPAIKIADVGAAMGITGVDVTKNTADIVLTDDNIATLVSAVEEGRHVAASVRKFVVHILTGNFAEVIVLLCGLAFRDDFGHVAFPLAPMQILWINMATSTPPAIGLSLDPLDPDAMHRNPDTGSFFNKYVLLDQAVYGALAAAVCFTSYVFVLFAFNDSIGYKCNTSSGYDTCAALWRARATCFVTFNLVLLCHGYVCRHTHRSLTEFSLTSNQVLMWSVLGGTALLFPILYVPVIAHDIFKHNAITWEWIVCLICLALFLCGTELYKYIKRRFKIDWDRTLTRAAIASQAATVRPEVAPITRRTSFARFILSPTKARPRAASPAIELTSHARAAVGNAVERADMP